jgi:hypothetical protein
MDDHDTVIAIAECMKELSVNNYYNNYRNYLCYPTNDSYLELFTYPSDVYKFIKSNYSEEGYRGITFNENTYMITEENVRNYNTDTKKNIINAFKLFVRFLIEHDSIRKVITDVYTREQTFYLDRLRDKFFSSPSRIIQAIIQEVAPGVYTPSKFVMFGSRKHGKYVKDPVRSAPAPAPAFSPPMRPASVNEDPQPLATMVPASALPASALPVVANGDPQPLVTMVPASVRRTSSEYEPLLSNVGGRRTARKHRKRRNHRKSRKHRR